MQSTWYSCRIETKLEFSRNIFEKYPNIQVHKNPSGGSRVFPGGRMDMTEANIRFARLCERT